jgi:hypothetical protein
MTISSTTNRAQFNCNGSTTSFPFTFKYLADSDLQVYLSSPAGVVTLLTLNVDYEITPAVPGPGGTLSFLGTYLSSPPVSGYTLTILRFIARTQEVDFINGDSLDENNIEGMGDKLTMMVQDLDERIGRAVTVPPSSGISNISVPDPVAGAFLRWNLSGNGLENATYVDPTLITISDYWMAVIDGGDTLPELATQAEVDAGTDDARIVTPKKLADYAEHRGMKNLLINGCMRVAQRAASQTLDHTPRYGPCDRWVAYWNSASGVTPGTQLQSYSADVEMWNTLSLGGLTCTQTNTLYAGQRIEARNSQCLIRANDHGGVSIQFKLWHNFGSAVDVYIAVATANSVDVFSAVTSRYVSSAISCPSDNWSTIKAEGIDIGTTDIDKGVFVYVSIDTPVCSGKHVYLADAQLEIGPKCTTIEKRSYEYELALCQRYYEKSYDIGTAIGTVTTIGAAGWTSSLGSAYSPSMHFKVRKRTAPTITVYSTQNGSSGYVASYNGSESFNANCSATVTHAGENGFIVYYSSGWSSSYTWRCQYVADAEL